jgi:DNA-binding NtrC family response regulator
VIDIPDLPESIQQQSLKIQNRDDLISLSELEYRHATRVLARVGGSQKKAAEVLGIGRSTLYRLLRRVGVSSQGPAIGQATTWPVQPKDEVKFSAKSRTR